ncbi:MAG: CHASE domain-containing protein [Sulfurimonas sp.]|nr:CHASE domain-containing protein [Sulfurimonas sp.]
MKIIKVIPFILMIVLFTISYQFYKTMKNTAMLEVQTQFLLHSQEFKTLVEQRMTAYEHVLHGTKGLFIASDSVDRTAFKSYIKNLMLDKVFPGIQGIGYSIIVPADKKDEFINKVRLEGFDSFNITPTTPRDFYTTILYLEPLDVRNKKAFGYDMFSNPVRRIAMEESRDNDKAIISAKVTLLQEYEVNAQAGFLMYLPIYEKSTKNEIVDERREHILGWIYAPFRVNDLMRGLKGFEDKNFDIEIYDNGIISPVSLMYDSYKSNKISLFSNKIEINIAGRNWTVLIQSTPDFEKTLDVSKAELVLVFGLIISFILVYIILQLINTKEYAQKKAKEMNKELVIKRNELKDLNITLEKRVEEKTQELQRANEVLEEHIEDLEVLNSKLTKAKEAALQAAQAKSNFISGISHELRTPLNAIINFTDQIVEDFDEILLDKEMQTDTKSFLKRVLLNSRYLLQLINDLLEFTKAEAGKMDYRIEERDINATLRTAYNNTYSLLNGTDVKFNLTLYPTPLIGLIDPRRFLQVLLNLLSNAIKFTNKGSVELRSFVEETFIVVEIKDTGKGIPVEKQKIIFEPFMQVNNTDNGTGLGLGLAKRMCDDMGIGISFSSIEGSGTTFRLNIKKFEG